MAGGGGGGGVQGFAAQPDDSSLHCASVGSREGRSVGVRVDYPLVSEKSGQGGPTRRSKSITRRYLCRADMIRTL